MLDQLVSMLGQLDPKDAEIVKALAEKYGVPSESAPVEQAAPTADPTVMEAPSQEQVVMGSQQALPPQKEQPVEAPVQEGQAPVAPIVEKQPAAPVEAVTEAAPIAPAAPNQPSMAQEVKMMFSDIGSQVAALKAEIESLKATLEQVAVREPVSEDEATLLEAKKQNFGQRVKGQPSNIPDKNVMSDLIKKLGGMSK